MLSGKFDPMEIVPQGTVRDTIGKLFNINGRYVSDAKALSELGTELDALLSGPEPEWHALANASGLRGLLLTAR
jgi:hypothetical protein